MWQNHPLVSPCQHFYHPLERKIKYVRWSMWSEQPHPPLLCSICVSMSLGTSSPLVTALILFSMQSRPILLMANIASWYIPASCGCISCVCVCVWTVYVCIHVCVCVVCVCVCVCVWTFQILQIKITVKSLLIGKVNDLITPLKLIKVRWLSLVSAMYFSPSLLLPHSLSKSEEKATFSVRGESKSGSGKMV